MDTIKNLRQWRDWRDDYRCTRPPVTCTGCDTHYPRGKDEGNAVYEGYRLVSCGNCKAKAEARRKAEIAKVVARITDKLQRKPIKRRETTILFPHAYRRVNRDIAARYIRRFDGSTESVQTAADDAEIYLKNADGKVIATVSLLDRYPKPPPTATFDEMPF